MIIIVQLSLYKEKMCNEGYSDLLYTESMNIPAEQILECTVFTSLLMGSIQSPINVNQK